MKFLEKVYYRYKWGGQLYDYPIFSVDQLGILEFGGDDITKILIKKSGMTGFGLSEKLFDEFDIEDEKTNEVSTMLLCGIGTTEAKLKKLSHALKKI